MERVLNALVDGIFAGCMALIGIGGALGCMALVWRMATCGIAG